MLVTLISNINNSDTNVQYLISIQNSDTKSVYFKV